MLELLINHYESFDLSIDDVNFIVKYFNDYIRNEENCIRHHILGVDKIVIQTIENLYIIVMILSFYVKFSKLNYECVTNSIEEFLNLAKKIIDVSTLEKEIESVEFLSDSNLIKRKMLSGNNLNIKEAVRLMLLYLLFDENKKEVADMIDDVLLSLEYFDLKVINKIVPQLTFVVTNKHYIVNHNQEQLIHILKYCFDLCNEIGDDRRKTSFDCLYNISELTRSYYNALLQNNITIKESLYNLIEDLKSIELNEVRNKWLDLKKLLRRVWKTVIEDIKST